MESLSLRAQRADRDWTDRTLFMGYAPDKEQPWLDPPECLTLTGEEVHVWRAYLNQGASLANAFLADLSADERSRQCKYYFQRDQEHFVIARGVLRDILSRYLKISPREIDFRYGRYGKPHLSDASGGRLLSFNVSHAHEIVLCAVSKARRLGIDIEQLREPLAVLEIAEQFFSPPEISALRALPVHLQTAAFFNCWTRKESYIKALGEGLAHPLDSFAVSLAPGESVSLFTASDPRGVSHWQLKELSVDSGYVASLAVEGKCPIVHQWQWHSKRETDPKRS